VNDIQHIVPDEQTQSHKNEKNVQEPQGSFEHIGSILSPLLVQLRRIQQRRAVVEFLIKDPYQPMLSLAIDECLIREGMISDAISVQPNHGEERK
jgi:hypothetical protein